MSNLEDRIRAMLKRGEAVSDQDVRALCDELARVRLESEKRWQAIGRLAPAAKRLRMKLALASGADSNTVAGAMADDSLPTPEPKEIDEKKSIELRHLAEDAVLKGVPYGDEQCDNCLYYLNPDDKLAYCWHPKLRILVGATWWCQWWEKIED